MSDRPPAPSRPARRWAVRPALVAGSTLLALVVGEVGLRLFAPQPTGFVATVPDAALVERGAPLAAGAVSLPGVYRYRYAHDAEGRRVVPGVGAGPEVLVLGDSFAWGMGVGDDETLAARLADGLGQRGARVSVTSGALPGVGPSWALRWLQTRPDARPAVAVYLVYPNDFGNVTFQTLFTVAGDSLRPRAPAEPNRQRRVAVEANAVVGWLRSRSHVGSLVWRAALAAVGDGPAGTGGGPANTDADTTAAPRPWASEQSARDVAAVLGGLRDEVAARGGALVLAYAPTAAEVAWEKRGGEPSTDRRAFELVRQSVGVDALDLTPTLVGRPEPVGALYFPETHWRPAAHAAAAVALLDPVQANLCAADLSRPGCGSAPEVVRRIAATRAAAASAGPSRRSPAD